MKEIEVKLKLSKELMEKLEERSKEAGFKTLQEYIIFILNEVVKEEEEEISETDEKEIKERLRALGYI